MRQSYLFRYLHVLSYCCHLLYSCPSSNFTMPRYDTVRYQASFPNLSSLKNRAVSQSTPCVYFAVGANNNIRSNFAFRANFNRRIDQAISLTFFTLDFIILKICMLTVQIIFRNSEIKTKFSF